MFTTPKKTKPRKKGRPIYANANNKLVSRNIVYQSPCVELNSHNGVGGAQPSGASYQVKYFDSYVANTTVTNVGTMTNLYAPTQGTGTSQRVGDVTFLQRLYMNYKVSTQNADVFNTVRLVLFKWIPNAVLLAPTFATLTNGGGTTTTQWMYDWQYSNQFKILYDRVHLLSGLATAPTAAGHQAASLELDLNNLRVQFSIGAATGSNDIFLFVISDSIVAPFPLLEYGARIVYCDEF
jgi:hypothetical protein